MPKLAYNLAAIEDLKTVPPGEYTLRVVAADLQERKQLPGAMMLALRFEIEGHPEALQVYHYVVLPCGTDPSCDETETQNRLRRLKRICRALGVPLEEPDTNYFLGKQCHVVLIEEQTEQYGVSNRVKTFLG